MLLHLSNLSAKLRVAADSFRTGHFSEEEEEYVDFMRGLDSTYPSFSREILLTKESFSSS